RNKHMLNVQPHACGHQHCQRETSSSTQRCPTPKSSAGMTWLQVPMLQLKVPMPARRTRLLVSSAFGLFAGVFCWYLMRHFHLAAGDFSWSIRAAGDLLEKRNPYATPGQLYPLPSALFGLPFVHMPLEIAAGIFYGLSSALLALGVTRRGLHYM